MTKRYGKTKRGFTLMELLVVIAIIVILVAISIPIFTKQLEKSREATDLANMRAAKAAAVTEYLMSDGATSSEQAAVTAYYNADKGTIQTSKDGITGYGKGTTTVGSADNTNMGYTPSASVQGMVIKAVTDKDGNVTLSWE